MDLRQAAPQHLEASTANEHLAGRSLSEPQVPEALLRASFDGTLATEDGPVANDCNDCDEPLE